MMIVRWAQSSDARALWALNEAFNGANSNTAEQIEASLRDNGRERVAICVIDGEAVGFLCAQRLRSMCYSVEFAEFSELYVDPRYRRRGAAEAMMRFMEGALLESGIRDFHLQTGADNLTAQALYTKLGFANAGDVKFTKRVR